MRKMLLPAILAFAGAACTSLPVMAGFSYDDLITRPYVIEKTCDDDYGNCQARMHYAPGENPGLAGPGSYWYRYWLSSPPCAPVLPQACALVPLALPHL